MSQLLTDRLRLTQNRSRAVKGGVADFLHGIVQSELHERLMEVNKSFTQPGIVTGLPSVWTKFTPEAEIFSDDEVLNVSQQSRDLMIHAMSLHWANDPVGQLVQSRLALKPDGLFLGAMLGGQTLQELRSVLAQAESEVTGGLAPRVMPMAEIRDVGALLQRAGFAMPVCDSVPLTVEYRDLRHLVSDLRAMGESNALAARDHRPISRQVFKRSQDLYVQHFSSDEERLTATFEVIFLTGWAPAPDQPQPLRPGSAMSRLADALGAEEKNPESSSE